MIGRIPVVLWKSMCPRIDKTVSSGRFRFQISETRVVYHLCNWLCVKAFLLGTSHSTHSLGVQLFVYPPIKQKVPSRSLFWYNESHLQHWPCVPENPISFFEHNFS